MTANVVSRAVRAGETLVRQLRSALDRSASRPAGARPSVSGWLAVTVLCEPADIDEAALPAPLAELADRIEVRVRPAADSKGTELAARLRARPARAGALRRLSGKDPEAELRSALRRAKQLIEVGEVLAVDPAPHGKRTATPGGALLESWTKAAPKAGVR
ncbi:hypothetical protein ACWDWO_14915 [Actinopolymorpha singaporensis]|uniref:Uncharacterized protein n=1 Tax=Actinopolymorpha singaporensis TaxID=117157 RepID=A0A1H1UJF1_9ACTN|nr:hypothetical protein [Actinopolymorpha singaporensis]SDS72617.1 hypothetical protein SAMN04489717_3658 [Actinopolymorpha singaporensis]